MKDEGCLWIVSSKQTSNVFRRNATLTASHLAFYREGYHMLLRDEVGPLVAKDILAWIENKDAALPSAVDARYSPPDLAALWGSKH